MCAVGLCGCELFSLSPVLPFATVPIQRCGWVYLQCGLSISDTIILYLTFQAFLPLLGYSGIVAVAKQPVATYGGFTGTYVILYCSWLQLCTYTKPYILILYYAYLFVVQHMQYKPTVA